VISVSSPIFSLIDFEMALGFIDQHFDAWEIMGEGNHHLLSIMDTFHEITPSYDMTFSAHAPVTAVNIGSLNNRIREAGVRELIAGLEAANHMNMDTYTIHPGIWTHAALLAKERAFEALRKSLVEIDRAARDLGVRVAMENMPGHYFFMGKRPEELLHFLEGTDIGICFDIGHAHVAGTLDSFLEKTPEFVNVHIHDNNGKSDEHLKIGDGNIDFRRVLAGMNGYREKIVIESRSLKDAVEGKRALMEFMDF